MKLDGKSLLAAGAAICGLDHAAAATLTRALRRLIYSDDWSGEADRLATQGLTVRSHSGPLREALLLPGDMLIVRTGDVTGLFSLLHHTPAPGLKLLSERWRVASGKNLRTRQLLAYTVVWASVLFVSRRM